jgi:hypothetical protein
VTIQTVFIHKVVSVTIGALDGGNVITAIADFKMVSKLSSCGELFFTNFAKSGHFFQLLQMIKLCKKGQNSICEIGCTQENKYDR